ncbi:MAG: heavy-metal-associated domain-containing protein [Clostridiales bacterium]|nr:heavy-metal-associated domain-containing protein [Clostridiales bacterium]
MKKTFKLEGLSCAACAIKIERGINELEGVDSASVNFLTAKLIIEGSEEKMPDIIKGARKIVKRKEPYVKMVEI